MRGIDFIAKERVSDYIPTDIKLEQGELALAASCYALPQTHRNIFAGSGGLSTIFRVLWPFNVVYWEPSHIDSPSSLINNTKEDRIKELAKAGALIAAEIDRLLTEQKK